MQPALRSPSAARRLPAGGADINTWWWVAIGFAAWPALAGAVGLWLGPVLRHCSQARDAQGTHAVRSYMQDPPIRLGGRRTV